MASSFIHFNDTNLSDDTLGFWINDNLFQVVCQFLIFAIDSDVSLKESWLTKDMRNLLEDNASGIFVGFMHLNLNEFLSTKQRKSLFINIIEKANELVLKRGEYISMSELNSFRSNNYLQAKWIDNLATRRISNIFNAVKEVINGEIKTTVKTNTNSYNF